MVNFPWVQQWNALVPESDEACQHYFWASIGAGRRTQRGSVVRSTGHPIAAAVSLQKSTSAKSVRTDRSSPVADRDNVCFNEGCYGLGGGVGRGLADGPDLGVGVGLGVGVAVAVPVAVAVGVSRGCCRWCRCCRRGRSRIGEAVGVGVGVPCGTELTAAKASTRPYPNELFGIVVLGIPPQV